MAGSSSTTVTTVNDLSEDCLVKILSSLPTFEAIQAGMVGPKWVNLWQKQPVLNFDILTAYENSPATAPLSRTRDQFANRISQVFLIRQSTPVHHFRLAFHYADFGLRLDEVRSWLRQAALRKARKLEFLLYKDEWLKGYSRADRSRTDDNIPIEEFNFCFSDVQNNLITELRLQNCGFNFDVDEFDSLETVFLYGLDVWYSYGISGLLLGCKNLRNLSIEGLFNRGCRWFNIESKKLETLTLRDHYQDFEGSTGLLINAPSLLSLTMTNFQFDNYSLFVPSLIEANIEFGDRSESNFLLRDHIKDEVYDVRRLRTQNMAIRVDQNEIKNAWVPRYRWQEKSVRVDYIEGRMLHPFLNLKHLELLTGYHEKDLFGISEFLRASSLLETLVLDYRYPVSASSDGPSEDDFYHDLSLSEEFKNEPLTLEMPSIKEVTLKNYRMTLNEEYLVELLKKNRVVLEKIVATPPPHDEALPSPILLWSIDEAKKLDAADKAGGEDAELLPL